MSPALAPGAAYAAQPAAAPESTGSAEVAKLRRAALDFEALLLKGLLELASEPWQGETQTDPAANTLKDLGLQAVARAMAASGGVGIARLIVSHFSATDSAPPSPP